MGIDYYSVLEISRSATPGEIRKAYARVAIRERPERTQACDGSSLTPEQLAKRRVWFYLANEAYEVLNQPLLRAAFDQFGEEGLKNGVPARDPDLFIRPYKYHGDPLKTFRNFFGTESASGPVLLAWQQDAKNGSFRRPDGIEGPWFREEPLKVPLKVTLEQLAVGGKAHVTMQRRELHEGVVEVREHTFEVELPPGVSSGTRFLFPQQGHQAPNSVPADVAVVIEDDEHNIFTRSGADLVATFYVSIEEALLGCALEIPALDGRTLRARVTDIVTPGYELRIPGEGLPFFLSPPEVAEEPRKECFTASTPKLLSQNCEPCMGCTFVSDPPCVCTKESDRSPQVEQQEEDAKTVKDDEEESRRGDIVLRFVVEYPSSVPAPRRQELSRALRSLTPTIPQHRTHVTPLHNPQHQH